MVQMPSDALLDTHVSGTDLPNTSTGGDTDDSTITPDAKETTWVNDDTYSPWQ